MKISLITLFALSIFSVNASNIERNNSGFPIPDFSFIDNTKSYESPVSTQSIYSKNDELVTTFAFFRDGTVNLWAPRKKSIHSNVRNNELNDSLRNNSLSFLKGNNNPAFFDSLD